MARVALFSTASILFLITAITPSNTALSLAASRSTAPCRPEQKPETHSQRDGREGMLAQRLLQRLADVFGHIVQRFAAALAGIGDGLVEVFAQLANPLLGFADRLVAGRADE